MTNFSLSGRKAAVAGGLGKIGRGVVDALMAQGAEVFVLDIEAALAADRSAIPKGAEFRAFDATDVDAAIKRIEAIDMEIGGFDVWVNCAYPKTPGWATGREDASVSAFRGAVDAQLTGPVLFAETVARRMAERGRGSIVQIGSTYGMVSPDFQMYEGLPMGTPSAYSAVKGGLLGHMRWLAGRYGRQGVRVNIVCPGGIEWTQPEEFKRRYNARTMLGRMARGEEIGGPVAFLASDAASYVTGAVLMADGGWTAL
jgi:NAD(P)-dependent dehydrogenase (short-subunit alcohol dehydrogenase family)